MDDQSLLQRYVLERSETAFAELVQRHLGLVYFAALRQTGDRAAAEDVTQEVFTDLARKARSLHGRATLTGWLYTSTRYAALHARRGEQRRRRRETEAHVMQEVMRTDGRPPDWERLRPLIDDALHVLDTAEREAVLLRFFQNRAFAEIGLALSVSEDAARKRVDRALDKLSGILSRRGVTSTAVALATALSAHAAGLPPSGLAASVTGTALASLGTGATTAGVLGGVLANVLSSAKFLTVTAVAIVASVSVATMQTRAEQAARSELAALAREQRTGESRAREFERRIAAAEQRLQAADADAAQLLKAVQEAAPRFAFPTGSAVCLAFVIDTSGSMRNPNDGKLWSAVDLAIEQALAAQPDARFVMGFNADGRMMFGGESGWLPLNADTRAAIAQALRSYDQDSISNPVPGIYRAMRELPPSGATGARLHVCVIGDEFIDQEAPVFRRLNELNVADATGRRAATISAIQLPTTIRYTAGKMGNTGLKFQSLMSEVAKLHGGRYTLLPMDVLP